MLKAFPTSIRLDIRTHLGRVPLYRDPAGLHPPGAPQERCQGYHRLAYLFFLKSALNYFGRKGNCKIFTELSPSIF